MARDRAGGSALAERTLLRQSGLLRIGIPSEWGGDGASWPEIFDLVRLLSRADSSLGHLVGFHFLMLATVGLFGEREQWRAASRDTIAHDWFWGNALNPLDTGTKLSRINDHLVVSGTKSFSSGSVDADQLIISALDSQTERLVVAMVSTQAPGVSVRGDWDNMGQRQTDSGTVEFREVQLETHQLLTNPGPLGSIRASLRPLLAQLSLTNVYLGIAEGALAEARRHGLTSKKPWIRSGVSSAAEDPYILRHYGEFFSTLEGARLAADNAARKLDSAWAQGEEINVEQRGRAAVAIATAKVLATHAALDVTARIFEVLGARATATRFGLDRFWRNARTHTLHDPVDYKLRELGEFALTGKLPDASFYS